MSIFQNRRLFPYLAVIPPIVWGLPYAFIKMGMDEFGIGSGDTAAKILFAGIRFLLAGLIVLLCLYLPSVRRTDMAQRGAAAGGRGKLLLLLVLYALVNTTLHYIFFYIGLSNSPGSRSSVLNSLGTFLLVLLSCAVFASEQLTAAKVLGCVIGFAGILLLNAGGDLSGQVKLSGDGMIVLNAVCSAIAGLLTRVLGRKMNVLLMTGAGMTLGSVPMIAIGLAAGGRFGAVTAKGLLILALLVAVSVVAFSVYNTLLKYHPVGKVAIFNSLIPIFGILASCFFLREPFYFRYFAAAVLVCAGVAVINREK